MISSGVFKPLDATLVLTDQIANEWPVHSTIDKIEQFAGAAIGSASVRYPANHAEAITRDLGNVGRIKIGATTIFRGRIGHGPIAIGEGDDEVQIVLFDDKWAMQGRVVGQPGIGTQGTPTGVAGFKDVGFEVCFNKDGRPNKDPSSYDFNTGATAEYWTVRDVLHFLFLYYVPSSVATISATEIAHDAYELAPTHLYIVGQTALQAVDAAVKLIGETWTLVPGTSVSTFKAIRRDSGTVRKVRLFRPGGHAKVTAATEDHAQEAYVSLSIKDCKDVFYAVSAPVVQETTYSTANELLARNTSYLDKEYQTQFRVDVSKYLTNNLGRNLSAGSKPKPWRPDLVTRMNSSASDYLTAAQIAASPALQNNKRVEIPVWVSRDGTTPERKFIVGGYRINALEGTIEFKSVLQAAVAAGKDAEALTISDWSAAAVWLTVATVLETPESTVSSNAAYLDTPMYATISKRDLVPEKRRDAMLPYLASTPHAVVTVAYEATESYVAVTDLLQDIADGAAAAAPDVETPLSARLPFFPAWQVGDRVELAGRDLGTSGNETIVSLVYDVHHSYMTTIEATNVFSAIDPAKFVRRR